MSDTASGAIVTPEAVRLDFETAGVGTRAAGALIDILVRIVAVLIVYVVGLLGILFGRNTLFGDVFGLVLGAIVIGILIGYPIICEAFWGGRTVGKMAMGTRVVTLEGVPVRMRHTFIRGVMLLVEFFLPPGGATPLVSLMTTSRHQRLGDLAAGTYVIRDRKVEASTVPVWFTPPSGWESYARTLDVSRITDYQYTMVRGYLLRTSRFYPQARAQLSLRIATPLARYINHTVPPGVTADNFLLCVAAAYQARHRRV